MGVDSFWVKKHYLTCIYGICINDLNYDDIKNEQRAVLLFDIIKLKLKKLEGYKMRRILQEDSVGEH